jgi:hypothetical protein
MLIKLPLLMFWLAALTLTLWLGGCGLDAGEAKLSFNEVMASNSTTLADDAGEYDDWIELFNAGDQDLELEGYFISDDEDDPYKKRLPAGLSVPAQGTLLLWADSDPEQGLTHLPFKLKAAGETISLTSPEGEAIDGLSFGGSIEDQVFGRYPDADGEFALCGAPTPGRANGATCAD